MRSPNACNLDALKGSRQEARTAWHANQGRTKEAINSVSYQRARVGVLKEEEPLDKTLFPLLLFKWKGHTNLTHDGIDALRSEHQRWAGLQIFWVARPAKLGP